MPAYFMSKQTSTPRGMRCNHPSLPLSLLLPFSRSSHREDRSFDETAGPLQKDFAARKARGGRIINELPPGQR